MRVPIFIRLGTAPACNRLTDGQTDGFAVANTALVAGGIMFKQYLQVFECLHGLALSYVYRVAAICALTLDDY